MSTRLRWMILACVLWTAGVAFGQQSQIPEIRSYKAVFEHFVQPPRGAPVLVQTETWYFLAPGSYRMETIPEKSPGGHPSTQILFVDKPGILLNHDRRTYWPQSPEPQMSLFHLPHRLAPLAAEATLDLGTKEIDGKMAKGFEVDATKLDPTDEPGPVEIWIDTATNLPVSVYHPRFSLDATSVVLLHQFEWNIELDARLFDLAPPAGYEEPKRTISPKYDPQFFPKHSPRIPSSVMAIILSAEALILQELRAELVKRAGLSELPIVDQQRTEKYRDIRLTIGGLMTLKDLLNEELDVAYYGKTVTARDGRKVILRWKHEDGNYQVVYADLSSDSVTPERLAELEK